MSHCLIEQNKEFFPCKIVMFNSLQNNRKFSIHAVAHCVRTLEDFISHDPMKKSRKISIHAKTFLSILQQNPKLGWIGL